MTFRDYLKKLETQNQLAVIDTDVSCDLEVAALARQEFKKNDGGKALLFNSPAGHERPVAVNLFGNERRLLQIIQADSLASFSEKLSVFLAQNKENKCAKKNLQQNTSSQLLQLDSVDLSKIPALRSWPGERDPYLTLALAVSRHPETAEINLGLYRAQIKSSKEIALNFSPGSGLAQHHKVANSNNTPLPVALLLGGPPIYWWLAAAPLPDWCDELTMARELFTNDMKLAGTDLHNLPYPEDTEMVIEGELAVDETRLEGPFGNHTGQYVTRRDCPIMHVKSIQQKKQAIIPATVVGPPPSENIYLGKANECLIRETLKIDFPNIVDISMPLNTIFHGAALLKVKSADRGQPRELIDALWRSGPLSRSKFIVLFDDNIDLASFEQCWWRGINGLHSSKIFTAAGRVAVDATGVGAAKLVEEDPEIISLLAKRKADYKI